MSFSKEFDVYSSPLPTPIKPNPYVRMSLPEMMTLLIEFHLSGYLHITHFYLLDSLGQGSQECALDWPIV